MTNIPIVLIVTCLVIGLCAFSGLFMGFVRKISGIVSFALACILVSVLLPTITSALRTTPVYTVIHDQCEKVGNNIVRNVVVDTLSGEGLSGAVPSVTADDGSGRLDREKIKAELSARGYDPSIIDSLSDADLESYAQQLIGATAGTLSPAFLLSAPAAVPYGTPACRPAVICGVSVLPAPVSGVREAAGVLLTDSSLNGGAADSDSRNGDTLLSQLTSGLDRAEQIRFIEDLPIPDALKEQMETFNNANGYQKLGATDFGSYVISYIANLILNILAFLVTLLVSWLVIRLLFGALSVFASLPVVGGINRLLGLAAGIVQGVLIMWVLFLILSLFATTPAGKSLMDEISKTPVLSMLYDNNLLMNSAANAFKGIL